MPDIRQAKILILATDGFEESELTVPQAKLAQAGATVTVAAPQSRQSKGTIRGWDKTDWGKEVAVEPRGVFFLQLFVVVQGEEGP